MCKYAIEIFYSREDKGYIAVAPELPGCSAFGRTESGALKEIKQAMELWLKVARKEKRKVPSPSGKSLLQSLIDKKIVAPEIFSQAGIR